MTSATTKPTIHSCKYDEAQDMLFILFAPLQGYDYYEESEADPDLLLRFTEKGARFIGLSLHNPLRRLHGAPPTPRRHPQAGRGAGGAVWVRVPSGL